MGDQVQEVAVRGVAVGLSLAAAPVFAVMALLTALHGAMDPICGAGSPLTGMAAMYGLMSAFHVAPWLRLIGRRRRVHFTP